VNKLCLLKNIFGYGSRQMFSSSIVCYAETLRISRVTNAILSFFRW